MKNQTISTAVFVSISFMLLLAGSYLSNFQTWLTFNKINEPLLNQTVTVVDPVGIRNISATTANDHTEILPPPIVSANIAIKVEQPLNERVKNFSPSGSLLTTTGVSSGRAHLTPLLISPTFIQYSDALVIEVPKELATPSNLKRAIHQVLLNSTVVKDSDLFSNKPIQTRYKPWFYKQVVNQYGRPIRYPADASDYAKYLLEEHTTEIIDAEGVFIVIQIPRVKHDVLSKIEKYRPWVNQYASRFNVSKELIFAIIEVESAFNPKAVSKSNALGLMQLKAHTAGRDVYQYIDGRAGQPSSEELFDAQNNLRMGIAYMGLLKHEYLQGVRNPKIKEMLSISSYNGGISRTLKLFGNTAEKAITRVNQLHPKRVYRILRHEHTSREARRYLDKVLMAKAHYSELLS